MNNAMINTILCFRIVSTLWFFLIAVAACAIPSVGFCEESAEIEEYPITEVDREHWAFAPLERPELPIVKDAGWVQTPIDRFVLAALEEEGLAPLPESDRGALIRRLSFDLIGLPPSPAEVAAFERDASPDAYERLVDRLLASHHYGQRWAQHWLDLARFAETDGFEHDKVRKEAWRYRDWVIDALNDDLPYDRFVRLQLAGDEIQPGDKRAAIATMFCLAGPDMPDINSQVERQHNVLNELTGTVGAALLGLQMGCAQCHDHKYDPISQADFYRLRAVFAPAVHVKKNVSLSRLNELAAESSASHLMIRGDWQRPGPQVEPAYLRIANAGGDDLVRDVEQRRELPAKTSGRRTALADWLTQPENPLVPRVIVNRVWQHHFGEGICPTPSDFGSMGMPPSHPELLDWLATELVRRDWSLKSIHRLIVTSATYRLAGRSTVASWSPAQRRQAKQLLDRAREVDPGNELLARFPRRRLSGEIVRDAMLASAGVLNSEQGGPGVMPPLPNELVGSLLRNQWKVNESPDQHDRRSIYIFARRNLRFPVFEAFDRPDANASCARRNRSTTALQSLLMINSEFSQQAARRLAGYLLRHADDDSDAQIELAFRQVYIRPPSTDELAASRAYLDRQRELLAAEKRPEKQLALPQPSGSSTDLYSAAALVDFCLALYNSSEFVYVD